MDQKRALFLVGAIILILLVVIFSVAYFSNSRKTNKTTKTINSNSVIPRDSAAPLSSNNQASRSAQIVDSNHALLAGVGYSLSYPKNWGILKCNNSSNVELDPVNSTEQLNVACDYALKPVTILVVKQASCPSGESVTLGNVNALKLRTVKANGDVNYKWCIKGSVNDLEVTHRVSSRGSRATSNEDYSKAVEEIIASYTQTPAGS